jgi:hypothetical protein
MWTYSQSSGVMMHDNVRVGMGYAGHLAGKNNPSFQNEHNLGPVPRGRWQIGLASEHTTHGPVVMRLTPESGTETFGRGGFLIHGDTIKDPGQGSLGCIVMPRFVRDQIAASSDRELTVTT